MHAVITVALPVFGVIAVGLLAGRLKLMSGADSAALNKFVFRFAMPAALFGLTASTPPPGKEDAAIVIAYSIAAFSVIYGAYFLSQRSFGLTKQEAGAHGFTSVLGNAVFLGLPIALNIGDWARPFVSLMLIEGVFIVAIAAALMAPRKEGGNLVNRIAGYFAGPIKNPLVVGMVAGFLYSAVGFSFAGPVATFFDILGRAAGPTALFSMGLFLATNPLPDIGKIQGRVLAIATAKLVLLPAIALATAAFLGVSDPSYLGALALFLFVPSGVGSFIMASNYGVYQSESAAAVSFTTLLSVLTIAGVLIVFT